MFIVVQDSCTYVSNQALSLWHYVLSRYIGDIENFDNIFGIYFDIYNRISLILV